MNKATFAAGCFWGPEITFGNVDGVNATTVGYMGGTLEHPTYQDVCTGTSGHAEVVQVSYDPEIVSYDTLLNVFWECHDPTQINQQGYDIGSQYRSAIFCHSEDQLLSAKQSRDDLDSSGNLHLPIASEIALAPAYWLAESYHQKYLQKRGHH
jgi:peptide-methionine (S)-S-oxide reductase